MQPIIFDHINKVVVQVADPASEKRFQEIVAAQRQDPASK